MNEPKVYERGIKNSVKMNNICQRLHVYSKITLTTRKCISSAKKHTLFSDMGVSHIYNKKNKKILLKNLKLKQKSNKNSSTLKSQQKIL